MAAVSLLASFAAGAVTVVRRAATRAPPFATRMRGPSAVAALGVAGSIVSMRSSACSRESGTLTSDSRRAPAFLIISAFGAVMADDDLHERTRRPRRNLGTGDGSSVLSSAAHRLAAGFTLGLVSGSSVAVRRPGSGAVLASGNDWRCLTEGSPAVRYGPDSASRCIGVPTDARSPADGSERTPGRRTADGPSSRRVSLALTGVALLFQRDRVWHSNTTRQQRGVAGVLCGHCSNTERRTNHTGGALDGGVRGERRAIRTRSGSGFALRSSRSMRTSVGTRRACDARDSDCDTEYGPDQRGHRPHDLVRQRHRDAGGNRHDCQCGQRDHRRGTSRRAIAYAPSVSRSRSSGATMNPYMSTSAVHAVPTHTWTARYARDLSVPRTRPDSTHAAVLQ